MELITHANIIREARAYVGDSRISTRDDLEETYGEWAVFPIDDIVEVELASGNSWQVTAMVRSYGIDGLPKNRSVRYAYHLEVRNTYADARGWPWGECIAETSAISEAEEWIERLRSER